MYHQARRANRTILSRRRSSTLLSLRPFALPFFQRCGTRCAQTVLAQPEKMKALKHGLICKASRVEDLRLNSVKTWKHMVLNYIEITELSFLTESSEFELPSPLAHNQAISISFTLDRFERGLFEPQASSAALAKVKDIWPCARGLGNSNSRTNDR